MKKIIKIITWLVLIGIIILIVVLVKQGQLGSFINFLKQHLRLG